MFLSIIVFFIILSVLVLIHELGHYLVAKKNNVYVEEFGFGLPPRIWGKKIGETLYSINWLPFGGFVKLLGEEEHELKDKKLSPELAKRTFTSKSHLQQGLILVAGVTMNFILGWGVITFLLTQGIQSPTNTVLIEQVVANSPAQKAGLQKGDVILNTTANHKTTSIETPDDLIIISRNNADKPLTMQVQRNSKKITTSLTPRVNPPQGQGALGIALSQGFKIEKYPWYTAPFYGLKESFSITHTIIKELLTTLYKFVTFQKVSGDIAGPVGIAIITDQAVKYGSDAVLQLLGILSFNLAIVNILPFPALDGGRLALVIYEAISRKKVNPKIEQKMNLVGFTVLLSLIVLVTIHDIIKIVVK
jgi:regulator of sigma E protease